MTFAYITFINCDDSTFLMKETVQAKSIIVGRMPRKKPEEFKTAFIKAFNSLDPFSGDFPVKELQYGNVEKVVFLHNEPNLEYFTEGNDLVLRGISQFSVELKGKVVEISAKK